MDAPSVRRQRILVPALAWLFAAGQAAWIDPAYLGVILASIAGGVYWTARWFELRGRAPAWGLLFFVTPTALASVDRMLVDATLLALFIAAAAAWEHRQWGWLIMALALASLTRETGVLLAAGATAGLALQREWKPACAAALSALPALGWMAYLTITLGQAYAEANKQYLFPGLWRFLMNPESSAPLPLQALNLLGLLTIPICLGLAVWLAWRKETLALLALPFLGLAILLGAPEALGNPYAYGRSLGPVFALVLWTGAAQRAWWFAAALPAFAGVAAYSAAALLRGLGWGT